MPVFCSLIYGYYQKDIYGCVFNWYHKGTKKVYINEKTLRFFCLPVTCR